MSKQKLSFQQKKILRSSSNLAIITTLSNLDKTFKRNIWLGKKNKYRVNTLKNVAKHDSTNINQNNDLEKYIAISPILHCFDGWIFLGRALNALSCGDSHTAHHLAYYAELRAAMSLLGGEGIGIFSTKHYVVNNQDKCIEIPNSRNRFGQSNTPTHVFSWLALEHWAGLRRSSSLLREIITPASIPLSVWMDGFRAGESGMIIGSDWLKSWGLDLRIISHDHEGRNEVSYRPNYLNYQSPINLRDSIKFILSIWDIFQPSGDSRFDTLDKLLLRLSLRKIYFAITGNKPEDDIDGFRSRIEEMLGIVNPLGLPHNRWKNFLIDNQASIILDSASVDENVTKSNQHHFSVIARAALLLRVASGAVARLINLSGLNKDDISFWWRPYGIDYGILNRPGNIENMEDLWADIEVAINLVATWYNDERYQNSSYYQCGQEIGKELRRLEECERVSYWGMGL